MPALRGLGVHKGDRVALVLPNCPQQVISFFAILRRGAIVVQNNPLYTAAKLASDLPGLGKCWRDEQPALAARGCRERAGRRRPPQRLRARGRPGPAAARRRAQPADRGGRRPARRPRAAHHSRLPAAWRGSGQRRRPAAAGGDPGEPAGGRRGSGRLLRPDRQRPASRAGGGPRAGAGGRVHAQGAPRLRGRPAAARRLRGRAADDRRRVARPAAALPLHQRQGPHGVDDRDRADRAGRAARRRDERLPGVQRHLPGPLLQAQQRPGQDGHDAGPGAAAADPGAEPRLPRRRLRGGVAAVRVIRGVPGPRAGSGPPGAATVARRAAGPVTPGPVKDDQCADGGNRRYGRTS